MFGKRLKFVMDVQRIKLELKTIFKNHQFPISGVVDYELAHPQYQAHALRYQQWIQNESHGEMAYLSRGLDRRLNPKLVFPELKSVLVVGKPYSPHPVGSEQIRYARYLNGPDYHEAMKASLQDAMLEIKQTLGPAFLYKICVDTSAVLERSWAALTGMGWIGKNTLFIHPEYGSYLFLGVVFTNFEFQAEPKTHPDYCGHCTRCLVSCPTQAFTEPHYLESKKCISYLTLEKRGEWKEQFDTKGFVAGCDLCQEVCPYNLKIVKRTPHEAPASYLITDEAYLKNETKEQYQARVKGTALSRIKFEDFKRNIKDVLE